MDDVRLLELLDTSPADGMEMLKSLEYDSRWTELTAGVLDPAAGAAENSARWYRYAPDGTVSRTNDTGDWEPYVAN